MSGDEGLDGPRVCAADVLRELVRLPVVVPQPRQHIDQLLWKAEVDLENVEDMYLRLSRGL